MLKFLCVLEVLSMLTDFVFIWSLKTRGITTFCARNIEHFRECKSAWEYAAQLVRALQSETFFFKKIEFQASQDINFLFVL